MSPEQFLKNYESALETQDWQAVSPLIHDDACVTFSSGTFKGKADIQQIFGKTFALIKDEEYAIKNVHWISKTEAYAVCLYTFHWSGLINGEPASGSGRGTSVLVNENGQWLLLTEHLGPNAN